MGNKPRSTCSACGKDKKFNTNPWCPDCDRVKRTAYTECQRCGKEKSRNRNHLCSSCQVEDRRRRAKPILDKFFEPGCRVCGEKDRVVLQAHHHPEPRNGRKMQGFDTMPTKSLVRELALCVPLCANCHLRVHKGKVTL